MMFKQIMTAMILVLSGVVTFPAFGAEDLREHKQYAKDDWRAYSDYDLMFNLDVKKLLGRPRSSAIDETVWIYTRAFAERFNMPSRWIGGKDFKGALALAYRKEIYLKKSCGYFGNWDNCRVINDQCLLDVYVSHDEKAIPWNTDKKTVVSFGDSSRYWLRSFKYKDGKRRQKRFGLNVLKNKANELTTQSYRDLESYRGYAASTRHPGIDSISWSHRFGRDGFGQNGGGGTIRSFQRNVFEGIDLITIGGMCLFASSGDAEMQVWFNHGNIWNSLDKKSDAFRKRNIKYATYYTDGNIRDIQRHKKVIADHKIFPGKSFMERVKRYQEEQSGSSFIEYFKKNTKSKK